MMIGAFDRNVRLTNSSPTPTREITHTPPRPLSTEEIVPYQGEENVNARSLPDLRQKAGPLGTSRSA